MNLYFAPLEGIGGYIYRNAQADYFEKADKYYSPFLAPNQNRSISPKEYKDIAPEHNEDIMLVPQIMANNAEIFLKAAQELEQLGNKSEFGLPVPHSGDKIPGRRIFSKTGCTGTVSGGSVQ